MTDVHPLEQLDIALVKAQQSLHQLLAEAVAGETPQQLAVYVSWLGDVGRILAEVRRDDRPQSALQASENGSGTVVAPTIANGKPTGQERRRKKYPLFFRDGDALIKIGWSKKSRSEYEHKAPRPAVTAVVHTLCEAGKQRRRFTMEKLMPFRDPNSSAEVPDYQAYIALAWLRAAGVVLQHGRQGYTLATSAGADSILNQWDAIPARES